MKCIYVGNRQGGRKGDGREEKRERRLRDRMGESECIWNGMKGERKRDGKGEKREWRRGERKGERRRRKRVSAFRVVRREKGRETEKKRREKGD